MWDHIKLPALKCPKPGDDLVLYLATTSNSVASVLIKEEAAKQWPVYYTSHTLQSAETRYPPLQKAILSLIYAARKLKPYFQGHTIAVRTDLPIQEILQRPEHSGRLAKWCIELGGFSINYESRKAIKGQALADFLAEFSDVEITHAPEQTPSPEPTPPEWDMFVDGSSKLGSPAGGIYLRGPLGMETALRVSFQFSVTNNVAEYEALIAGLKLAIRAGIRRLHIHSDSQLVIHQVQGCAECKDVTLIKYLKLVNTLRTSFEEAIFIHIPRAANTTADMLSKGKAPSAMETLARPSIAEADEVASLDAQGPIKDWRDPIIAHLKGLSACPQTRKRAVRFVLIHGLLWRRGFAAPLQRCLSSSEGYSVLETLHHGNCGSHIAAEALAHKALRQGYYWPTLKHDATSLVKTCHQCQINSRIQRLPSTESPTLTNPVPFALWGLDLIGPMPTAPGQYRFCVVAVDYFTKWIKVEPLASITSAKIIKFLWKNIVCRYGSPRAIITDNGTQFASHSVQQWAEDNKVRMLFAPVAHPQSNGQVEVTNRTLKEGLKKRLTGAKGRWVDELPSVLWDYRTTTRTPTGETPFSLVYGTDALLPIEADLPTLRMINFTKEANTQGLRARLDLIEELREGARLRMFALKQRLNLRHNTRVKPKALQQGGLALLKSVLTARDPKQGVLRPNWEGPYVVHRQVRPGVYELQDHDGHTLPRNFHADDLRPYYV